MTINFPNWEQFCNFVTEIDVRIIAKKILREYWIIHPDCEQQLKSWFQETNRASWKNHNELKHDYPNASIIADTRVVFNIKGNHYRLIVKINYDFQICWIRFIGTQPSTTKLMQRKFRMMMKLKPIKTESDYDQALKRLEVIFDAKQGTPEGDELEILSILIDEYEQSHFPIDLPDPVEAIKFRMEQMGYTQNDLANVIGRKSRASEILSKKRKLSLSMIRNLHEKMNIPTEVLIQEY